MTSKKAFVSVSDKTYLLKLVQVLRTWNFEIVSTGGTQAYLQEADIAVTELSQITNHKEILSGRVKTLHPAIFSGILARDTQEDKETLQHHNYVTFDIVIVNFYPFLKTAQINPPVSEDTLIEQIDIGGPSLLRAAAKNHARVCAVSDPNDYDELIDALQKNKGQTTPLLRKNLALRTFARTAYYDSVIGTCLAERMSIPAWQQPVFTKPYILSEILRYGENPHQQAAAWIDPCASASLLASVQKQGKMLSYNNLLDADAALRVLLDLSQSSVVIIKHQTPCGVAQADHLEQAYIHAFECDQDSAFGGIVAFSSEITPPIAKRLVSHFYEVIIAPNITEEARTILSKKPNLRVLELAELNQLQLPSYEMRTILGGLLIQTPDKKTPIEQHHTHQVVTKTQPTLKQFQLARFANSVCKHVKSNAIVLARSHDNETCFYTVGICGGQTMRASAVQMAIARAKIHGGGEVLASDAFFPFQDSIQEAQLGQVRCIIQPGGSKRDQEIIQAAETAHISMIFTGVRHFKH